MSTDSPNAPPPIYTQQDTENAAASPTHSNGESSSDPQVLILPAGDTVQFQSGFLGADDERAAIEGEVQIKGADGGRWDKLTLSLQTFERAGTREVELASSQITLFSAPSRSASWPSVFPFAMPLTADMPQCIHARRSSLEHTLSVTLSASDGATPDFTKSLQVHTRRYSPHSLALQVSPRTRSLIHPTPVDAQVPRTVFKAGEHIPVYVTIPPPPRELVVDRGVRLRNIRVELTRVVRVRDDAEEYTSESETETESEDDDHVPLADQKSKSPLTSLITKDSTSADFRGVSEKTIISRSGASCRFHSTRPIRLRFVLHPPVPSDYHSGEPPVPSAGEYGLSGDTASECASISQTSVLHSVSFRILVHIGFVEVPARTERTMTLSIPVTLLPPSAPLPEVEPSVDTAYRKKHDKPPSKTVRGEDTEISAAPHYSEGEPGPSSGAPPPFEERDAPPPFFSVPESSTARLPTFLESETDTFMADDPPSAPERADTFQGEGVQYGFTPSEQFDGHDAGESEPANPPPTMEEARGDADVTDLASLGAQPELANAIEALGLVLEQHTVESGGPPPPPPMDDPSDPPPHIDSEFRTHNDLGSPQLQAVGHPAELPQSYTGPPNHEHPAEEAHSPRRATQQVGNAPPPYVVPEGEHEHAPDLRRM